ERGVARVPVVRHADRLPAVEVGLRVPLLRVALGERVVLAEVPGAAEQLAAGLAFVDERFALGRLHHQWWRRLRGWRRRLAARRTGPAALCGGRGRQRGEDGEDGQRCQGETQARRRVTTTSAGYTNPTATVHTGPGPGPVSVRRNALTAGR